MEANPNVIASPTPSSSSHSLDSSNSYIEIQFNGLKKSNFFINFRKDICQLTSYIYSVSPSMTTIHDIMTVLRSIQFLLPCFVPSYLNLWKKGTIAQMVMNVLAVPCYFIPPSNIFSAAHYFVIVYLIIQAFIIFLFIGSSWYFKRNAKLPNFIPKILYFYMSTFSYYFHPIILFILCEGLSFLTTPETRAKIMLPRFISIHVLSFFCAIFNFFFIYIFQSQTLAFRPNSLASSMAPPQYLFFTSTILINLFFGLGVNFQKQFQALVLIINIFLYLIVGVSVFAFGGFIKTIVSNMVLSSSITGAVFTFINMIFIVLDKNGSLALFFSFILFFIIMMIMNYFLIQRVRINAIKMLDLILDDNEYFSVINTPNKFFQLANCGIEYAHPIVLNLSLFNMAIEKWPNKQYVYYIFAKFVAIYPEESTTLKYIYKTIKMGNYSGSAIRCIKGQTKFIMRQREIGLSSELRKKINSFKRQNLLTKHKLGRVWDVVIRGNLNEIEITSRRAISAINEENADIKHLLHEYPNNRFVAHFYSNFLNDLMADQALSCEMHERAKMLLPGLIASGDKVHDFGLQMFPNLPNSIKNLREPVVSSLSIDYRQSFSQELEKTDFKKERQNNLDQIAGIKSSINDLRIPSIIGSRIIQIVMILFLFVIPICIGLIYISFYTKKIQRPLPFIGSLAMLRAYAYQVIGFSLRYLGENMTVFRINPNVNETPPTTLGNTWDTKQQLASILQTTTKALQDFSSFRMFEDDNYYINQAQNLIFQNTVDYVYYTSSTNKTTTKISIQAALLDFTIQQKMILTGENITSSILNSGTILNPINNASPISNNIREAMDYMNEYISNNYKKANRIGKILFIVLIIADVLIFEILLIIQLKWTNSNKQETYQCLFSIPKNVISELGENRKLKKDENNNQAEEMNKQDENILKIFNSGGTTGNLFSDGVLLIIGTNLLLILSIICISLFIRLTTNLARTVRNLAPHLYYLMSSYSMILSSLNWLHVILFEFGGYPIPTVDFNLSFSNMKYVMQRSRYYYHLTTSGGPTISEVPFKGFTEGVRRASPTNCSLADSFYSKIKNIYTSEFSKLLVMDDIEKLSLIFDCLPVDMIFVLVEPIILSCIYPYQKGVQDRIEPLNPVFSTLWSKLISPLYENFFYPTHHRILPTIEDELRQEKYIFIPIICVLLVVGIIIEIILYFQVNKIEKHIKSVLELLLHCSPSVIFSSTKISRVLTGDFTSQQSDTLDRNSNFFDTVFTCLPDAIMYANTDMIIQCANQACQSIFDDADLIGKSMVDFFKSNKFSGNVESLFAASETNPTEEISYKNKSGTELILKATSMIACGKFVISCRNVTQAHNYNMLILEEKQNSDKLLSTILPPSLVTRVQEGEKNISFSVQSASILFSDIVSFTPWCGSLPPEKVMSTLNILFKRFDSILDTKTTMTKIKCIGDCYMAAGGIFAEINQPEVHAEEVVSFGLHLIKEIKLINKEIEQNLKIRVGINTGGPIVAGVLGIGKPTFEIIGPTINRAQQMEHNGIPMKVHISSAVYELICGLNFKFCNRRTIECKNEKVETYLVEP